MSIKFSQEDAEFLADWFNYSNQVSTGIISKELKDAFDKADDIRIDLTQSMFENSRWRFSFVGKNKRIAKIYYDKEVSDG
jgi:hypothetical protein